MVFPVENWITTVHICQDNPVDSNSFKVTYAVTQIAGIDGARNCSIVSLGCF